MENVKYPEHMVFGLDIGTRSIVGTVGYKQNEIDFVVVAQSIRYHETRAMLDGQIHDIGRVADTITEVKRELEKQIGKKLTDVCIAAAGRVLKTVEVNAEYDLGTETIINDEHIHSLELTAIEKAYNAIGNEKKEGESDFYCVGYTVITYYLNGNVITNLEEHKGTYISADVLVTFLPEEVVDGLYRSVEKAGLNVENLTLEPIAAINVAIPEKFRLLNIALVDVGAGTSDICITKGGSIVAYGMIPRAGDKITEVIVEKHLVEFAEAENIKIQASGKKKIISYKDIMRITGKVSSSDIINETKDIINDITGDIAARIIELNGGKPVSAVFVVGGGGKLPTFTDYLAKHLKLQKERVALRGEEVLGFVKFLQPDIQKDPLLVTPIGICLNYYEKKNNFIFVQVNGERVKLYDNGKLTIIDAAMAIGFQNEKLFAQRGKAINFTLNGQRRLIRGGIGEPAQIILNNRSVSIAAQIVQNDIIEIKESTIGEDASYEVGQLPEYGSNNINFIIDNKKVTCPKFIMANNELVSEFYNIKDGDELRLLNYYTLSQIFEFLDLAMPSLVYVNNKEVLPYETNNDINMPQFKIYENFSITFDLEQQMKKTLSNVSDIKIAKTFDDLSEPEEDYEIKRPPVQEDNISQLKRNDTNIVSQLKNTETWKEVKLPVNIKIKVNQTEVVLKGKSEYVFVDILDFYHFDFKEPKGKNIVMTLNGEKAEFSTTIKEADVIEIYWVD